MSQLQRCGAVLGVLLTLSSGPVTIQGEEALPAGPEPTVVFKGHATAVSAMVFRSGGRQVVSACRKHVRVWDAMSGTETAAYTGTGGETIALGPDGSVLASAGREMVTVRDVETGKERFTFEAYPDWDPSTRFRPRVNGMAFSPDGLRLATAGSVGGKWISGGVVTVWDAQTGKRIQRDNTLKNSSTTVAFSADGRLLAATTVGLGGELPQPGQIRVWEIDTGKVRHTFESKVPEYGEFASATDVAFSADGKRIAAAVSAGDRGQPAGLIVPDGPIFLRIWQLTAEQEPLTLRGHSVPLGRVAFSPDGNLLASAGQNREVFLWDAATGRRVTRLAGVTGQIEALLFSPDGRRIAAAGSAGVFLWTCPEI